MQPIDAMTARHEDHNSDHGRKRHEDSTDVLARPGAYPYGGARRALERTAGTIPAVVGVTEPVSYAFIAGGGGSGAATPLQDPSPSGGCAWHSRRP